MTENQIAAEIMDDDGVLHIHYMGRRFDTLEELRNWLYEKLSEEDMAANEGDRLYDNHKEDAE